MNKYYLCDGHDEKCNKHKYDCYINGGECKHTLNERSSLFKNSHLFLENDYGDKIEVRMGRNI